MHIYAIINTSGWESLKGYNSIARIQPTQSLTKPCDEQYQYELKMVLPCFITSVNHYTQRIPK